MPAPKKLSTGTGRVLEEWPPIPRIALYQVEAIKEWLGVHRNVRRPPDTAAWVLAVLCALEEQGHYTPARRRLANALAEHYGETVKRPAAVRPRFIDSIDSAVSTALAETEIYEEWRTVPGAHERRAGVVRHRYLRPSKQLMLAWRSAVAERRGLRVHA